MGSIHKRPDSPFWWYTNGTGYKRIQKSTGSKNKKIAQRIADHWDNEIALNKFGVVAKKISFEKVAFKYIRELENAPKPTERKKKIGHRKPTKLTKTGTVVKELTKFFETECGIKNIMVSDITREMLVDFFTWRNQKVVARTIREDHICLKMLYDYIVQNKYAHENIVSLIPKPPAISEKERVDIPIDVCKKAIDNAPTKEDAIFWTLLLFTGLRVIDAINLEPNEIKDDFITLVPSKTKLYKTWVDIPLHKKLLEYGIEAICNCMSSIRRKNQSLASFKKTLKDLGYKHPDDKIPPDFHSLRHTWITLLETSDVPTSIVSWLAGHSSQKTTRIYKHMSLLPHKDKIVNLSEEQK